MGKKTAPIEKSSKKKKKIEDEEETDDETEEDDDFEEDLDEVLASDSMVVDEVENEGKRSDEETKSALHAVMCPDCDKSPEKIAKCKIKAEFGCP